MLWIILFALIAFIIACYHQACAEVESLADDLDAFLPLGYTEPEEKALNALVAELRDLDTACPEHAQGD